MTSPVSRRAVVRSSGRRSRPHGDVFVVVVALAAALCDCVGTWVLFLDTNYWLCCSHTWDLQAECCVLEKPNTQHPTTTATVSASQ